MKMIKNKLEKAKTYKGIQVAGIDMPKKKTKASRTGS